jgi:hypothetical protein
LVPASIFRLVVVSGMAVTPGGTERH